MIISLPPYLCLCVCVSVCVCVRIKEIERDGRLCDASKIIPLFGIGCDPHDDKSTKQYQGAIIVQGWTNRREEGEHRINTTTEIKRLQ